jgi:alpha/beta superfamily hydrolase
MYHAASWLVLLPLLGVVVLLIALHFSLHPPRRTIRMTPSAYGLSAECVTFDTEDGFELRGWFISGLRAEHIADGELKAIHQKRPTVILCHDLHGARDQMLAMARVFHDTGSNCLLFDFRGHGESGGNYTSFGLHEIRDVEAAIHYVRLRAADCGWIDPEQVTLYGVGMGAVAAMHAAARDEYIVAAICDSPFLSLDAEFRREAGERLPAGDVFAGIYKLGYNCWFQDSADRVDALAAARKLRGRPLMVICPPRGLGRNAEARAVYEAAGTRSAALTVTASAGPRWMNDPTPIAPQLQAFLRSVAPPAAGDPSRPTGDGHRRARGPDGEPTGLNPGPHPTGG